MKPSLPSGKGVGLRGNGKRQRMRATESDTGSSAARLTKRLSAPVKNSTRNVSRQQRRILVGDGLKFEMFCIWRHPLKSFHPGSAKGDVIVSSSVGIGSFRQFHRIKHYTTTKNSGPLDKMSRWGPSHILPIPLLHAWRVVSTVALEQVLKIYSYFCCRWLFFAQFAVFTHNFQQQLTHPVHL